MLALKKFFYKNLEKKNLKFFDQHDKKLILNFYHEIFFKVRFFGWRFIPWVQQARLNFIFQLASKGFLRKKLIKGFFYGRSLYKFWNRVYLHFSKIRATLLASFYLIILIEEQFLLKLFYNRNYKIKSNVWNYKRLNFLKILLAKRFRFQRMVFLKRIHYRWRCWKLKKWNLGLKFLKNQWFLRNFRPKFHQWDLFRLRNFRFQKLRNLILKSNSLTFERRFIFFRREFIRLAFVKDGYPVRACLNKILFKHARTGYPSFTKKSFLKPIAPRFYFSKRLLNKGAPPYLKGAYFKNKLKNKFKNNFKNNFKFSGSLQDLKYPFFSKQNPFKKRAFPYYRKPFLIKSRDKPLRLAKMPSSIPIILSRGSTILKYILIDKLLELFLPFFKEVIGFDFEYKTLSQQTALLVRRGLADSKAKRLGFKEQQLLIKNQPAKFKAFSKILKIFLCSSPTKRNLLVSLLRRVFKSFRKNGLKFSFSKIFLFLIDVSLSNFQILFGGNIFKGATWGLFENIAIPLGFLVQSIELAAKKPGFKLFLYQTLKNMYRWCAVIKFRSRFFFLKKKKSTSKFNATFIIKKKFFQLKFRKIFLINQWYYNSHKLYKSFVLKIFNLSSRKQFKNFQFLNPRKHKFSFENPNDAIAVGASSHTLFYACNFKNFLPFLLRNHYLLFFEFLTADFFTFSGLILGYSSNMLLRDTLIYFDFGFKNKIKAFLSKIVLKFRKTCCPVFYEGSNLFIFFNSYGINFLKNLGSNFLGYFPLNYYNNLFDIYLDKLSENLFLHRFVLNTFKRRFFLPKRFNSSVLDSNLSLGISLCGLPDQVAKNLPVMHYNNFLFFFDFRYSISFLISGLEHAGVADLETVHLHWYFSEERLWFVTQQLNNKIFLASAPTFACTVLVKILVLVKAYLTKILLNLFSLKRLGLILRNLNTFYGTAFVSSLIYYKRIYNPFFLFSYWFNSWSRIKSITK